MKNRLGFFLLPASLLWAMACGDNANLGRDALVDTTPEPAGDNCPSGGVRVISGVDENRDGVLSSDEISSSSYICNGGDGQGGQDGANGADGMSGANGSVSLLSVDALAPGSECPFGGLMIQAGIDLNGNGALDADEVTDVEYVCDSEDGVPDEVVGFTLLGRYHETSSAEIVATSADGRLLAYTQADAAAVGFLDIANASRPVFLGEVNLADVVTNAGAGEPTSVAITPNGQYALAVVKDTSDPIGNADPGTLAFIDLASLSIAGTIALGVGPDSIKITPDGSRALIAIEDEEDTDRPAESQARPGSVQVVAIDYAAPASSAVTTVALVPDVGNNQLDPQPEFIDISDDSSTAIVSLQENNAIAVIDLGGVTPQVVRYIDAGVTTRTYIDIIEDDEIELVATDFQGRREPDAVCLLSDGVHFVTANEGDTDLDDFVTGQWSGGRGFSIFDTSGNLIYDVGDELDQLAVQNGMYPEGRSENRGLEIEGCAVKRFGNRELAFLLSERGSAIAVYDVTQPLQPAFVQFLPAPLAPESVVAVDQRGLLIVAGEGDGGGGGIWIYRGVAFEKDVERYPDGVYRAVASQLPAAPFSSFSAATATGVDGRIAVVHDDSFSNLRMWVFEADESTQRMRLVDEVFLTTAGGEPLQGYNPQGLSMNPWGGFVVAVAGQEDNGCDGTECPETDRNRLLFFNNSGELDGRFGEGGIVDLPESLWDRLPGDDFGGVAVAEDEENRLKAYVVFRQVLDPTDEDAPEDEVLLNYARIGAYDAVSGAWSFYFYPLRGNRTDIGRGQIRLTDIAHVGGDELAVIERDRHATVDARFKTVFTLRLSSGRANDVRDAVEKHALIDLLDTPFAFDYADVDALAVSGSRFWLANNNNGGGHASFFYELRRGELPQFGAVRFATFNASLNRNSAGAMTSELATGTSTQARVIAEIIQRAAPDVILLNEFDYDPSNPELPAQLFRDNYLSVSQNGAPAIEYPYAYVNNVNTGLIAPVDLDGDGAISLPNDGFGFGSFHGQFGMVLLSRYPIDTNRVRTFQTFRWADMPGALLPDNAETPAPGDFYSQAALDVFRLSSKSHWDVPINVGGRIIHVLASHPTPPVFDGPEDRNGLRNHDEIRFFADYVNPAASGYIYDDNGVTGGLPAGAAFVILGDLNADPFDGDSVNDAVLQLLEHPLINTETPPASIGGIEQGRLSGRANGSHEGNPAYDTGDFNDNTPGNLRVDYVLPSRNLDIVQSAVFWPSNIDPLFSRLIGTFPFPSSDHRLVWVDVKK